MPQHRRKGPLGARFDGVQGVTELLEAQAVSRRNAVLGCKTRFPSACASGFEAIGDIPSAGKPEARAEGMRAAAQRRLAVSLTDALGTARTAAERRQAQAVSRRNAVLGCKTRLPSACASGFEAIGDIPSAGKPEARAEGINDSTSPNPRSHSPGFAATGNDRP